MLKADWAFTAVSPDYPCGCSACVSEDTSPEDAITLSIDFLHFV